MQINQIILLLALFCYLAGGLHYILFIIRRKSILSRVGYWSTLVGVILHFIGLVVRGVEVGRWPFLAPNEAISFWGFALAAAYIVIARLSPMKALGAFMVPAAFLMVGVSAVTGHTVESFQPVFHSASMLIHVPAAIIAQACFLLAAINGLMFILQKHELKSGRPGWLYFRLPPLEKTDSVNFYAMTVGFLLFTIATIVGIALSGATVPDQFILYRLTWTAKETWTLIAWFFYALLLQSRLVFGWKGRRYALGAIAGFFLTLVTFMMTHKAAF